MILSVTERTPKPNVISGLVTDLKVIKRHVDPLVKVNINTLTQAALYSFAYNVDVGNFAKSRLLKNLNANDGKGACDEMKR
ncbi:glycoside hydrolase family protein [Arsenophonus endosymbiont of Bemisia tabaci]|uniref:glycoside hydrolase family protein n=1 Tax=Arsenophonus endosymbiont of Bemisia tabaci TaxID=536059 RepID=UPI0030B7F6CB